jgi:hypothetical protein
MMHINCYMIKYKVIYGLLNVITAYSIDLTNKQQDMVSTDVKHRPRIMVYCHLHIVIISGRPRIMVYCHLHIVIISNRPRIMVYCHLHIIIIFGRTSMMVYCQLHIVIISGFIVIYIL